MTGKAALHGARRKPHLTRRAAVREAEPPRPAWGAGRIGTLIWRGGPPQYNVNCGRSAESAGLGACPNKGLVGWGWAGCEMMCAEGPNGLDVGSPERYPGRQILNEGQWETVQRALQLSSRELDIVKCLFDDQTEQGVAHELEISPHTVHTHLERLYRKLGVRSRTGALLRVFELCLDGRSRAMS